MDTLKVSKEREFWSCKVEVSKIYLDYLVEIKKLGGKLSLEQEIVLEQNKSSES
jgi:hypothetical protein